ncbi:MAG: hypothetical protein AAFZ74_03080 [Pseudomonadota bacterium]
MLRDLTEEEVDVVNGAWVWHALGALVGGVSAAAGASVAGGSYRDIGGAFVGGAIGGAVNPVSSATRVFTTVAIASSAAAANETITG